MVCGGREVWLTSHIEKRPICIQYRDQLIKRITADVRTGFSIHPKLPVEPVLAGLASSACLSLSTKLMDTELTPAVGMSAARHGEVTAAGAGP